MMPKNSYIGGVNVPNPFFDHGTDLSGMYTG